MSKRYETETNGLAVMIPEHDHEYGHFARRSYLGLTWSVAWLRARTFLVCRVRWLERHD